MQLQHQGRLPGGFQCGTLARSHKPTRAAPSIQSRMKTARHSRYRRNKVLHFVASGDGPPNSDDRCAATPRRFSGYLTRAIRATSTSRRAISDALTAKAKPSHPISTWLWLWAVRSTASRTCGRPLFQLWCDGTLGRSYRALPRTRPRRVAWPHLSGGVSRGCLKGRRAELGLSGNEPSQQGLSGKWRWIRTSSDCSRGVGKS